MSQETETMSKDSVQANDAPNRPGDFIWYELMTNDVAAAEDFYGPLLGWHFSSGEVSDMDYRLAKASGPDVAGLMGITDEMREGGAQPAWLGYLKTDNIEDSLDKLETLGGKKLTDPMHIPGIGHFSMVADPQGAFFYLMQAEDPNPSTSFARYHPAEGHCAWNELSTTDQPGADAFYTKLFGWEKGDTLDMGEMGPYDMYNNGDYTLGAIMRKPDNMPVSLWSFYFRVPNINDAENYVREHGGQLVVEPMEIPSGDQVFCALDPQGAMFCLIGKKGS